MTNCSIYNIPVGIIADNSFLKVHIFLNEIKVKIMKSIYVSIRDYLVTIWIFILSLNNSCIKKIFSIYSNINKLFFILLYFIDTQF